MAQERVIFICNTQFYLDKANKFLDKNLLPLTPLDVEIPEFNKDNGKRIDLDWLQLKSSSKDEYIIFDKEELNFADFKDYLCIRINNDAQEHIIKHSKDNDYIYISCEGDMSIYKVITFFSKEDSSGIDEVVKKTMDYRAELYNNPAFKDMDFSSYGIPPKKCIVIPEGEKEIGFIEDYFHAGLIRHEPKLANKLHKRYLFGGLKGEGTLKDSTCFHLSEIMTRIPSDTMKKYFKTMDKFSQYLSSNLQNKKTIVQLEKNHKKNNQFWKNKLITFIDGGMSTIKGMPLENPQLVRVGDFSVKPGASLDGGITPAPDREKLSEKMYAVHDIFNDDSIIQKDEYEEYVTNHQKRNEAARYIFEAHYAWMKSRGYSWEWSLSKWEKSQQPDVIFFHGPLQNKFELYCQNAPHFIPGIDKNWLKENHITEEKIKKSFGSAFKDECMHWNAPLVVYAFLMKEMSESKVPILGCVERSSSASMSKIYINNNYSDKDDRKKFEHAISRYKLVDDKLWGYVLDEGQYIQPLQYSYKNKFGEILNYKQNKNQLADPNYGPIIEKFPYVYATMLNCAFKKLPFRIELNNIKFEYSIDQLISLVYHTSLLLPVYLFPVGLDIVDKHVKIPASISHNVDRRYLINAYATAIRKDADEIKKTGVSTRKHTHHVMQVLSAGPARNFFNRPSESKINNMKRGK